MFRKFRVQNFMCLKDVTVNLEPLTIFAGPNSSGKSALFKALTTFTKLLWYPTHGGIHGDFNVEYGVGLAVVSGLCALNSTMFMCEAASGVGLRIFLAFLICVV